MSGVGKGGDGNNQPPTRGNKAAAFLDAAKKQKELDEEKARKERAKNTPVPARQDPDTVIHRTRTTINFQQDGSVNAIHGPTTTSVVPGGIKHGDKNVVLRKTQDPSAYPDMPRGGMRASPLPPQVSVAIPLPSRPSPERKAIPPAPREQAPGLPEQIPTTSTSANLGAPTLKKPDRPAPGLKPIPPKPTTQAPGLPAHMLNPGTVTPPAGATSPQVGGVLRPPTRQMPELKQPAAPITFAPRTPQANIAAQSPPIQSLLHPDVLRIEKTLREEQVGSKIVDKLLQELVNEIARLKRHPKPPTDKQIIDNSKNSALSLIKQSTDIDVEVREKIASMYKKPGPRME